MSTYVYKYTHPDYPWLYVGKADTNFEDRIYRHGKEKRFLPFLDSVKIYYMELENKAQSRMVELYLIDKYKPYLNTMDKYEGESFFEMNIPEWKLYTEEFTNNSDSVSLIHWGKFPVDSRNSKKDNEIIRNKLKEKDDYIANLRQQILENQNKHAADMQFYYDLLENKNNIIQFYMELLSKWEENYDRLLIKYNSLNDNKDKRNFLYHFLKKVS